jgi:hypothetical protein
LLSCSGNEQLQTVSNSFSSQQQLLVHNYTARSGSQNADCPFLANKRMSLREKPICQRRKCSVQIEIRAAKVEKVPTAKRKGINSLVKSWKFAMSPKRSHLISVPSSLIAFLVTSPHSQSTVMVSMP